MVVWKQNLNHTKLGFNYYWSLWFLRINQFQIRERKLRKRHRRKSTLSAPANAPAHAPFSLGFIHPWRSSFSLSSSSSSPSTFPSAPPVPPSLHSSIHDIEAKHRLDCHFSLIAFSFRRTIELHGISSWSSAHYVCFHRRISLRAPAESLWKHRLF